MSALTKYEQYYPWFAPEGWTFYNVTASIGIRVGAVARDAGGRWWADNARWARGDEPGAVHGGQLVNSFDRRYQAADALWHIANETATAEQYGGYATVKADAFS